MNTQLHHSLETAREQVRLAELDLHLAVMSANAHGDVAVALLLEPHVLSVTTAAHVLGRLLSEIPAPTAAEVEDVLKFHNPANHPFKAPVESERMPHC